MANSKGARVIASLGIGVIALGAVGLLVHTVFSSYERQIAEANEEPATVTAIVAARDLFQGVPITEADLFAVSIPSQFVHPGVFRSPELVVGRIPRERILANEFVREGRLADADRGFGLNAFVPRGMRAISVNIHDGNALSGHLDPGAYVDVLVTLREARGERPVTDTLLQQTYVLAVNSRSGSDTPEAEAEALRDDPTARRMRPSVTLAVTPEQAEAVAHAAREGEITLALRHPDDVSSSRLGRVGLPEVLGEEPLGPPTPVAPVRVVPQEEATYIQIIRGSETTDVRLGE